MDRLFNFLAVLRHDCQHWLWTSHLSPCVECNQVELFQLKFWHGHCSARLPADKSNICALGQYTGPMVEIYVSVCLLVQSVRSSVCQWCWCGRLSNCLVGVCQTMCRCLSFSLLLSLNWCLSISLFVSVNSSPQFQFCVWGTPTLQFQRTVLLKMKINNFLLYFSSGHILN